MAITLNTFSTVGEAWGVNGYSADWSGGETLVAEPSAGDIYVEQIIIHSVAAETFTIRDGTTARLGPFTTAATAGAPIVIRLLRPMKVTGALTAIASAADPATVIVEGFTR